MIKIYVITVLMLISITLKSEEPQRYSFGFGIQTLDYGFSQLLRFDCQKNVKKNWYLGFTYLHSSFNIKFSEDDYMHTFNTIAPLHFFSFGQAFTYPDLLKNNESQAGSIKLEPYSHQYKENLFLIYLNQKHTKNSFEFSYSFGLGLIHYNFRTPAMKASLSYINNDTENKGIYLMMSHHGGLSAAAYVDINLIFHFKNSLYIGKRLSFDYDIIDFGGFPLKNDFFVGIKY